jgi:hypothetical protein
MTTSRITDTIDWILRVVGVTSLIFVLFLFGEMREQDERERIKNECQARVNAAQSQRSLNLNHELTVERNAERRADDALAEIVRASLAPERPTPAESRRLVTNLLTALSAQKTARTEADEARKENPPVPAPEEAC